MHRGRGRCSPESAVWSPLTPPGGGPRHSYGGGLGRISRPSPFRPLGALAPSPIAFAWCKGHRVSQRARHNAEVNITNRGIRLHGGLQLQHDMLHADGRASSCYFFDLKLEVLAYETTQMMTFDDVRTQLEEINVLTGIYLRKYGPALFYRDAERLATLSVRRNLVAWLSHGASEEAKPFYLAADATIDQVARITHSQTVCCKRLDSWSKTQRQS